MIRFPTPSASPEFLPSQSITTRATHLMLGTTERMKISREQEQVGGMETIKGGFPLPINWHVHYCNSSRKLSTLKRASLLRRSKLQPCFLNFLGKQTPSVLSFSQGYPFSQSFEFPTPQLWCSFQAPPQFHQFLYSPDYEKPNPKNPLCANLELPIMYSKPKGEDLLPEICFQKLHNCIWVLFFFPSCLPCFPVFVVFFFLSSIPLGQCYYFLWIDLFLHAATLWWMGRRLSIHIFKVVLFLESCTVISCTRRKTTQGTQ